MRKVHDRIAVKIADQTVTYAELNAIANRIARTLLAEQGHKSEPVGLLFEKGVALIAAILGVLKADKFFVLLDPSFPKARIAEMLNDLGSGILLANQHNLSSIGHVEGNQCRFLELESCDLETTATDLQLPISPSSYALIFYTSGSTGEPKGVIQSHRNMLHNIMLRTKTFRIRDYDKLSLLASGTPNAVVNMFLGLLNGATLLPFDVQKEGTTGLGSWLLREKVSICWTTAALFRKLCETLTGKEGFPDIRYIVLASDMARKSDFDLFKKYFSSQSFLANALTGSETGLLRTFIMDHKTEIVGDDLPVGYGVEDKEILLLDDRGKQVGFNELGETVVRSRYLSPGYWRRPNLTEAKFKPDPEGGESCIYFTGDLGLILPDGCLIHKGRKDFRVKIRGYGVEISEVEKALLEHANVAQALVVACQNESGEARLVAYFVSSAQPGPTVSELRGFLRKKLPEYMIPSAFVMLRTFPLTPNGKVDRLALPALEGTRPELDTPLAAPGTPIEEELVKIWAEVLSLDQVGVHDDFFELGGHSLAATRVVSRVLKAFEMDLPIQSLFQSPTVEEMAKVIARHQAEKLSQEDLAGVLAELDALSDEEAKEFAAREGGSKG